MNPAQPDLAVIAMVLAGAVIAGTSILAKVLGQSLGDAPGLHPLQISAGRFVFGFAALIGALALRPRLRPAFAGTRWRWHLLRSICGWLGVTLMFAAVARMPVAEATAISFLSPLVAMALAVPLLGERLGPRKWIAACLACCGAALILRPGTDAFQAAGLWALAAAAFMGVETIFIKRLTAGEPPMRILLVNNAIGAGVSGLVALSVWSAPTGGQWLLLVALGTVMVAGQSLFIQAMRRGEASHVMPAFYSILVFAAVYDAVLFGVRPGALAIAGAALIVTGAVVLAVQRTGR
ncbi:MAG: DMT family transporter [Pseudomonadota bacterium]